MIPFSFGDRALFVGIGLDQAGIDGKAFAADKPFVDAALDDALERAAEDIALAKTAMPVFRER